MKEPFCKNCLLFDKKNSLCRVIILHEGERYNLPVDAEDSCFFENEFIAVDSLGKEEKFKVDVQQLRMWEEDKKVKIEYPDPNKKD